jgi:hypothetical protein
MQPLHVCVRASDASPTGPQGEVHPSVLMSLVRETDQAQRYPSRCHVVDVRLKEGLVAQPLPDLVQSPIVAICPDGLDLDNGTCNPQIPIASFCYDEAKDFSTFLESHFGSGVSRMNFFLSPASVVPSLAPTQWRDFTMRFLASAASLSRITVLLLNGGRAEPDAPLSTGLLGVAPLDASNQLSQSCESYAYQCFQLQYRPSPETPRPLCLELEWLSWTCNEAELPGATVEAPSDAADPGEDLGVAMARSQADADPNGFAWEGSPGRYKMVDKDPLVSQPFSPEASGDAADSNVNTS